MSWPISFEDVRAARERVRPFLTPTPLRSYAPLDDAVGHGIRLLVKHENHQPTNSFKIRNAFSAMTALSVAERERGVIAATRGNHGLGLAYAGRILGIPVTVCVPRRNNPEKNEAMRGYGAELIEEGADYDEAVTVADRIVRQRGLTLIHSTNNVHILAGAATLAAELLEQEPALDAIVLSLGGSSQVVGALVVAATVRPAVRVHAVQASGASAAYQSWRQGHPVSTASADTFADGIAVRSMSPLTFPVLRDALAGFVTVTEAELASAIRLILRTTHNLVEGAAAAGLAGVRSLGAELEGQRVAIVLSGGNIDERTLRRVVNEEI